MSRRWTITVRVIGVLGFLAPLVDGITTSSVIAAVVNGAVWVGIVYGLWLAVEGVAGSAGSSRGARSETPGLANGAGSIAATAARMMGSALALEALGEGKIRVAD